MAAVSYPPDDAKQHMWLGFHGSRTSITWKGMSSSAHSFFCCFCCSLQWIFSIVLVCCIPPSFAPHLDIAYLFSAPGCFLFYALGLAKVSPWLQCDPLALCLLQPTSPLLSPVLSSPALPHQILPYPTSPVSESLFYFCSFHFVNELTCQILTLTTSLFTLQPSLLHCFHLLSTLSPYSSPPYLPFPLNELKSTPTDKKWIIVLWRLRLQFASGTNSTLATSLKSLRSCWSFSCCPHEQDQRPALVDLPRAFSPPPDPTPGWLPAPPHKQTMIWLQATCSACPWSLLSKHHPQVASEPLALLGCRHPALDTYLFAASKEQSVRVMPANSLAALEV